MAEGKAGNWSGLKSLPRRRLAILHHRLVNDKFLIQILTEPSLRDIVAAHSTDITLKSMHQDQEQRRKDIEADKSDLARDSAAESWVLASRSLPKPSRSAPWSH